MKSVYQTLNNGSKIPQMGFGVYLIEGDENTKRACLEALKIRLPSYRYCTCVSERAGRARCCMGKRHPA